MSRLLARFQPPRIPTWVVPALAVAFAVLTIVRGIGWSNADPGQTLSRVVLDGLADPGTWGALLITAGALVILAYASRLHLAVWTAHGLAAVLYAGIVVAISQAAALHGAGWEHVGPPLGALVWHVLIAWLTGPLPRRQNDGSTDADQSHRV